MVNKLPTEVSNYFEKDTSFYLFYFNFASLKSCLLVTNHSFQLFNSIFVAIVT